MKTKSFITIDGERVHVDTTLLFQRLIAVYSLEELSTAFMYELSSQPMSLFDKDGLMNDADKPKLKEALKGIVGECNYNIPNDVEYVLDGGSLLHKVQWSLGQSFQEICNNYISYIRKRYGQHATVVFDGGYMAHSTKDTAHIRRAKGRIGKTVELRLSNPLTMKKSDFLLSNSNKQDFLLLLGSVLTDSGINVFHSNGDADLLVVQTALNIAKCHSSVIIGEDTGLLVLALYHFKDHNEVYFTCAPTENIKSPDVWSIGEAKRTLTDNVCDGLLLIHAITGCDTTSRVHTIGKASVLHKFQKSTRFRELSAIFLSESSSKEDIVDAGEKLILQILGASKKENSMDELRLANCYRKLGGKSAVKPQSLGPTSDATAQHSPRVYHQVQAWQGRDLIPEEWAWILANGKLMPVKITLPPAPQELLKIIRCTCKVECTPRCTCVTYGLKCTTICTGCRGVSCRNCLEIDIEDEP